MGRMKRKRERERESAGPRCPPTWANRMCDGAHIRELGQGEGEGGGDDGERERRAYACVRRALCTCIAGQRWRTATGKKRSLSYGQCENERGYRLCATENAMRFISSLCGPPPCRVTYEKIGVYYCNLIFYSTNFYRCMNNSSTRERWNRSIWEKYNLFSIPLHAHVWVVKVTLLDRNNHTNERGTSGCSCTEDLRVFEKIVPEHIFLRCHLKLSLTWWGRWWRRWRRS